MRGLRGPAHSVQAHRRGPILVNPAGSVLTVHRVHQEVLQDCRDERSENGGDHEVPGFFAKGHAYRREAAGELARDAPLHVYKA